EAERLGSDQVDEQLVLGRPHHRQIGGLAAFGNSAGIDAGEAPCIGGAGSVADQSTLSDALARLKKRRDAITGGQRDKWVVVLKERWTRADEHRLGAPLRYGCECRFEVAVARRRNDKQRLPNRVCSAL